jgi:hypothetical protein
LILTIITNLGAESGISSDLSLINPFQADELNKRETCSRKKKMAKSKFMRGNTRTRAPEFVHLHYSLSVQTDALLDT